LLIVDCRLCNLPRLEGVQSLRPGEGRLHSSLTIRRGAAFATAAHVNEKTALLQKRIHTFFVGVIALCRSLPRTPEGASISKQLLDSADESLGWLQALSEAQIGDRERVSVLLQEANELTAIFVSSRKTAERNQRERDKRRPSDR
jgi:hypothetical protein